jgi:hypothetical protein
MNLSRTLEVICGHRSPDEAIDVAGTRGKRWFDPDLVKAAASLARAGDLWRNLHESSAIDCALALEPEGRRLLANDRTIENICPASVQPAVSPRAEY